LCGKTIADAKLFGMSSNQNKAQGWEQRRRMESPACMEHLTTLGRTMTKLKIGKQTNKVLLVHVIFWCGTQNCFLGAKTKYFCLEGGKNSS